MPFDGSERHYQPPRPPKRQPEGTKLGIFIAATAGVAIAGFLVARYPEEVLGKHLSFIGAQKEITLSPRYGRTFTPRFSTPPGPRF